MGFGNKFGNRFGDDDYEPVESDCAASKKTIQPKSLNTIHNQVMNIVQNATTYVQAIEIDECQWVLKAF